MNYVIAIFTFLIGLGVLFAGFKTSKLKKKIKHWQKTKMELLSIEIIPAKSGRRNLKTIIARYSFKVNGKLFEGKMVNSIELIGAEKGMLQKQAVDEIVKIKNNPEVWYNPDDPTECYLLKFNLLFYFLLFPLGFLMVAGSIIWFVAQILG